MLPSLATQLVGSFTKPRWLYRREALLSRQLDQIWAPAPEVLLEAKQDAIRLAIADQERAGLDIITDGEQVRESFANYFYRLGGIDLVSLDDGRPLHQVPLLLWTPGGVDMTHNPVWFETTATGLRGYFMPEDDKSTLYVYEVNS